MWHRGYLDRGTIASLNDGRGRYLHDINFDEVVRTAVVTMSPRYPAPIGIHWTWSIASRTIQPTLTGDPSTGTYYRTRTTAFGFHDEDALARCFQRRRTRFPQTLRVNHRLLPRLCPSVAYALLIALPPCSPTCHSSPMSRSRLPPRRRPWPMCPRKAARSRCANVAA
ncbi:hypothetical protein BD626DRAFT_222180 [Schizophyllum amplum]|uniref:Uncharacterized protein n=1 Tax=Schizophyllum amplum TaxID=97359 RepID=A0A550BXG7_9AGAR|nr:hypothetical protein BD626DRAFT_222180 [Auriculariopsis ampla]